MYRLAALNFDCNSFQDGPPNRAKISSMNDRQLEDLKQFIDGRISQTEGRFDERLDEKIETLDEKIETLDEKLEALRKEMLDGFTGVGDAIEEINKMIDERLTKLENQAA